MKWLLDDPVKCECAAKHRMQRSEISLPGDWPHLQTTCFALRHCRKTHLDTQKTLIKPNCQPRSPWTIQTQTLEHTWTYIPQVFSSFLFASCRGCAIDRYSRLDTVGCLCGLSSTKEALRSTRPWQTVQGNISDFARSNAMRKDDDDGGLNLASGWWEVYGSIRSRGFESIRIVSALISTWLAISLHCSAMLGGDTTWR